MRQDEMMIKITRYFISLIVYSVILIFGNFNLAIAATNISTNTAAEKPPIKIGTSLSLTGDNSQSGQWVKTGIEILFNKINATGGIQGQKLELIALDDGYEPLNSARNVRQLIDEDKVLALIGNNGTPTAIVTMSIADEKKVLLFGPRSGSVLLHKLPSDRYIFNLRSSYADEVTTIINGLLSKGIKSDQIAFFTQNDSFGNDIYQSGLTALKAAGFANPQTLAHGYYERNSRNVIGALSQIVQEAKTTPKVFILGCVSDSCGQFINLAHKQFPQAMFIGFSGLINAKDLSPSVEGQVLVSQVVPPLNSNLPAVHDYLNDLKTYGGGAKPAAISFEAYLVAKLFVIGLQQSARANDLTREGIIDVFENMKDVDIGIDTKISFSKTNHNALHKSWLMIYKNGELVPIDWSQLQISH